MSMPKDVAHRQEAIKSHYPVFTGPSNNICTFGETTVTPAAARSHTYIFSSQRWNLKIGGRSKKRMVSESCRATSPNTFARPPSTTYTHG
ncbi:unnamed protein product [Trichogramma brassicae]|uniref:Uncharacterized protein n=1 Tax=Trichogramma brassicae TaxID=86971 RepID=A0A6H5J452_9HYME|nr:unnamed protein product [Trichogramma brassicae]